MNEKYNSRLKQYSQELRRNMTKEEKHLWYDFLKTLEINVNRQKIIGNYIVDFCISNVKIIIELDGSQHFAFEERQYDVKRDGYLKELGYTVLRYSNNDVNNNFRGVCEDILKHIDRQKRLLLEEKLSPKGD